MAFRNFLSKMSEETWLRLLLLASQGVGLLGFGVWFGARAGLPLDDAWIHQVVARTLVESGTMGYAPGQHGAAATSYLWAALLAVNLAWLHLGPATWAFLLNAASTLATGQLVYALLLRVQPAEFEVRVWRYASFAATCLACNGANVLWYAHSGMEASFFLALSTIAVWAATRDDTGDESRVRTALLAGIAGALLTLTRPEGAGLAALLVLVVLYRSAKRAPSAGASPGSRARGWTKAAAILAPPVLAILLYVGSNLAKTGRALPTTLSGRR